MKNYEKIITEWLFEDYIKNESSTQSIDIHVDQLLEEIKNNDSLIIEGLNLYKALIKICKEKNLLNKFIPVFRINLKNVKKIKKIDIQSMNDILNNINFNKPPEICLYRKIKTFYISNIYEEYRYSITNVFLNSLFDDSDYYFYFSFFRDEEDIKDNWSYTRTLQIEYNKNIYEQQLPNSILLKELIND